MTATEKAKENGNGWKLVIGGFGLIGVLIIIANGWVIFAINGLQSLTLSNQSEIRETRKEMKYEQEEDRKMVRNICDLVKENVWRIKALEDKKK